MSFFTSIVKFFWLTKEDPNRQEVLIWRLVVSAFMTFTLLFVVFSLGGLWSVQGFAYAEDIDDKIEQALEPVGDRLEAIETEQSVQGVYLRTLVKSDFKRLIDRELLARCAASTREERNRINSAIEAYQMDYEAVFGFRYAEPDCEDL